MAKKLNSILEDFRKEMNLNEADMTQFTEVFQEVFEEALLRDKIVKISGLGTFKLIEVEPRKSVDVNTGEEIEIAGHYKLNFIPEAALKEQVNKPLSHLEIIELEGESAETGTEVDSKEYDESSVDNNDPLQKLADEAAGLKGILDDIQGVAHNASVETSSVKEEDNKSTEEESKIEPVKETKVEERKATVTTVKPIVIKPTPKVTVTTKTNLVSAKTIVNTMNTKKVKKQKKHTWVWVLVAVILLVSIIGILVYAYWDPIISLVSGPKEEVVDSVYVEQPIVEVEEIDSLIDKTSSIYNPNFSDEFNRTRTYTDFISTEELTDGSRLAWISLKQYGHSYYWVYIYEANRDILDNPNQIMIGTKVKVPRLENYLIDTNNPETLEYARYLHDQYVIK